MSMFGDIATDVTLDGILRDVTPLYEQATGPSRSAYRAVLMLVAKRYEVQPEWVRALVIELADDAKREQPDAELTETRSALRALHDAVVRHGSLDPEVGASVHWNAFHAVMAAIKRAADILKRESGHDSTARPSERN